MKLTLKEKRLLKSLIKKVAPKSYVGIIIVHYGETSRNEQGIASHELLVDSMKGQTIQKNVPCQWGILKLFM